MWCCARNTKPGKRCSSTGRGQRSPCMTPRRGKPGQHRCLFLCSAPAPIPTQKRLGISNWKPGLKAAKLRGPACVEDIDYRTARGLDKTVVRALAKDSAWVRNHENIFVLGPTGVGKSFIASALAQKACRDGYSALYLRAAALLRELALARADGS